MRIHSPSLKLAFLCNLLSMTPMLNGANIDITQETQNQLPIDQPVGIDDYLEATVLEDVTLTGANNAAISTDGGLLITGSAYSFTLNNGGLKGREIQLYELAALSFTSAEALEGVNGILDASVIDPATSSYSTAAGIYLVDIENGITFNNNGSSSGTKPNAALWSWAELTQPLSSGGGHAESQIQIATAPTMQFSDNYWESGAIQAYAKGTETANSGIIINNIQSLIFENNSSGDSLISARSEGPGGSASIEIDTESVIIRDNTSGDSTIKARASGDPGKSTNASVRIHGTSLLLSGNTSSGDGGVISALTVSDPQGTYNSGSARVDIQTNGGGTIESNSSAGNGGAVSSVTVATEAYMAEYLNSNDWGGFIFSGTLESDFVFQNNHAEGKGGAVYVSGGGVSIDAFTADTDITADVIFRGNTMGNHATGDLIANSLYVESNNGYQAGITSLKAQVGNSIIFEGSVISQPGYGDAPILHINYASIPARGTLAPASSHDGQYKGTIHFTGRSVESAIGPKQTWESDEHYQSRLAQSRTSRIDQEVILHNGTLAVTDKATLIIRSLYLDGNARVEMEDGNFDGARLNTNFGGLIHSQGNIDLSGLADIDIRGYLMGTRSMSQSSSIMMKIDSGNLLGIIEIMNVGDLYAQGLLADTMTFNILTLILDSDYIPDTSELFTNADRFNEGLGITDPDEQWVLTWEDNFAGDNTRSLVLHKNGIIPEPASAALALLGLASMAAGRRRRRI